jgi:transcription termination factor Rho
MFDISALKEMKLSELQEIAKAAKTIKFNGVKKEVLIKQIDEKVQQLQESVINGNLETFEDYKKLCGEIRGLLTARGYTLDLKDRMENSDE